MGISCRMRTGAFLIVLLFMVLIVGCCYCSRGDDYDKELARAMERHSKEKTVVVPVIARDCLWKALPFGQIQALPRAGKAIATWDDQDAAAGSRRSRRGRPQS